MWWCTDGCRLLRCLCRSGWFRRGCRRRLIGWFILCRGLFFLLSGCLFLRRIGYFVWLFGFLRSHIRRILFVRFYGLIGREILRCFVCTGVLILIGYDLFIGAFIFGLLRKSSS